MNITPEEVARLQDAWRQEFDEETSEDDARRRIWQLDALYLMLSEAAPADEQPLT